MVRRIAVLVLTVAAVMAAIPSNFDGYGDGHIISEVFAQQPAANTGSQLPASPQIPNGDSAEQNAFAVLAERYVSRFDVTITPSSWMALEHEHQVEGAPVASEDFGCLTLEKTDTLPSGRKVTVTTSFYVPRVPSPLVFPTLTGQELINRTCTLAAIRVQTRALVEQDGHALAQALKTRLESKYGQSSDAGRMDLGKPSTGENFSGFSDWQDVGYWKSDHNIFSAYDPTRHASNAADPDRPFRDGAVFVFSQLPTVHELEREACCSLKTYRYRTIENSQFHRALAIAGADAVLSERLEKLYEEVFRASASPKQARRPENTTWRESLAPVLRDWFGALNTASPARRAAGLLAADRLLASAEDIDGGPLSMPKKPHPRSELQALGAAFDLNGISGAYFYTNNWLKQARELDPDGPAGQMAVVGSLARGSCNTAGPDPFRSVILDGEGLLAKGLDAPTAAQLHFMVGDAYSDIVAIAGGEAGPNGEYDPEQFSGEAASARVKALDHYRAGLALDNTSENAKDAWRQAWHLSAGLLPSERYVCFGD